MKQNKLAFARAYVAKMYIGQVLKIYKDPITCLKLEGMAELIKIHCSGNHKNIIECIVRFPDGEYYRRINLINH